MDVWTLKVIHLNETKPSFAAVEIRENMKYEIWI